MLVSPIGFGAFKIGRNEKTKYPSAYDLPDETAVETLLNGVLDLGINYIDTAPAYGLSEERIGRALSRRRSEFVLATKVGETFADGVSCYDFSADALRRSVERSLRRLATDVLDVVLLHSDGRDVRIQTETDAIAVLQDFKQRGLARAIGLSGKTPEGARHALGWADVLMVEYHIDDPSHTEIIAEAARARIGVVVKKGLASGRLPPADGIRFVLSQPDVSSLIVGGLNLEHVRQNVAAACNSGVQPA
jgi:aryl-alcohol dehydrogenase-like predicted oxidoreductase